jgi:hypothetical protein
MAVGVNKYRDSHLKGLKGPHRDLDNLRNLLVKNPKTAIYQPEQFIELRDPDSFELRMKINEYVMSRPAEGDIFLFYFSGHGVPIGRDDFGFCTTDTIVHTKSGITLPLSVVKFSEILSSLNPGNIIPVIIIDACYSGIAGKRLTIPPVEAISTIQNRVHTMSASSYCLLCSCSELDTSIDTTTGGVFSKYLVEILSKGFSSSEINSNELTLQDIFPKLNEMVLGYSGDTIPRLYLGSTLPRFPLTRNPKFKARKLTLTPLYIKLLEALWNNGNEQALSPEEISQQCGKGAYGNHNKLSLEPWQLVENVGNSRNRRLTQRGKQFLANKLSVPKTIVQDPQTKRAIAAENSELVNYKYFVK